MTLWRRNCGSSLTKTMRMVNRRRLMFLCRKQYPVLEISLMLRLKVPCSSLRSRQETRDCSGKGMFHLLMCQGMMKGHPDLIRLLEGKHQEAVLTRHPNTMLFWLKQRV
uniref:Uncharacterized protein n=1 Tax=Opuntia streptacantha TaxID=393608 RepID=A0A7C8YI10_OPUST